MRIIGKTINGQPVCQWPELHKECARHERFVIEVRKYDEQAEISRQQMAYLHAAVFPALAEYTGVSELMAETILKIKCGEQWFIRVLDGKKLIGSKTDLTVKQTSKWMENIWEYLDKVGCKVMPPDPEWYKNNDLKMQDLPKGLPDVEEF